ncbi:MAG: acetyl-CoA carboxylase biotin carboxyl carrier protein subunit [Balneolaceae bacterium]|nr:MAG: acetyl-CoA carboxylase biotin carboxyl carrier protein subunit [Balneolaceae bacterium]
MKFECRSGDLVHSVTLNEKEQIVESGGQEYPFEIIEKSKQRLLVRSGTKLFLLNNIETDRNRISFTFNGKTCVREVKDELDLLLDKFGFSAHSRASEGTILAPMPGKIIRLMAKEGEYMEAGQPLIILEAMKMENELKTPVGGVLSALHVTTGETVEKNQPLAEIKSRG